MTIAALPLALLPSVGCEPSKRHTESASPATNTSTDTATTTNAPPQSVQAWMDRLTVAHEYDPKTGFIVAREVVALPPLLAEAPPLDAVITQAGSERIVIAFVTADRCAPCQQYKRDALNDAGVLARLASARLIPTHLEIDRSPALADAYLGARSIPMTYALRDGKVIAALRGQRTAADLSNWIDSLP